MCDILEVNLTVRNSPSEERGCLYDDSSRDPSLKSALDDQLILFEDQSLEFNLFLPIIYKLQTLPL